MGYDLRRRMCQVTNTHTSIAANVCVRAKSVKDHDQTNFVYWIKSVRCIFQMIHLHNNNVHCAFNSKVDSIESKERSSLDQPNWNHSFSMKFGRPTLPQLNCHAYTCTDIDTDTVHTFLLYNSLLAEMFSQSCSVVITSTCIECKYVCAVHTCTCSHLNV